MEKFKISSALFPCVSVDTYETMLSPVQLEDEAMACNESEYRPFDYAHIDCGELDDAIVTYAKGWIEDEVLPKMQKYGLQGIDDCEIHHPREYNFTTDCLLFTAIMSDDWRERMNQWLARFTDAKFQDYIDRHFKSCDGFISWMPQSFAEIRQMDDKERCIGAYLTLCLLNESFVMRDVLIESQEYIEEQIIRNGDDATVYNALEDAYKNIDTDSLLQFYNSWDFDIIYWQIVEKSGFPWLHDNETKRVRGEHETVDCENDAQRFIAWAARNGYDVATLRQMAA